MKVSASAYQSFVSKFGNGDFGSQRFGQAFLNHFESACPHEVEDGQPCIFHADRKTAQTWIEANGVDWSSQKA